MARTARPLTATQINKLKAKNKTYKLHDGEGLTLLVYPSGKKVWRLEYTRKDKKRDSLTMGPFPEFSLADARKKKLELRTQIAKGENPKRSREKPEGSITLNEAFSQWYERWHTEVTPRYALQVERAIKTNILSLLGKREVTAIKPKEIVEALTRMEERGCLEYLRRTKQALRQIFDFCVGRGECEFNPVANIGSKAFKRPNRKNFAAPRANQLAEFLRCLQKSSMEQLTKGCILWMLSTLCRPAEATNMPWTEVDLDNKIWTIPAERMKKRKEYQVPLSNFSLKLLKNVGRYTSNERFVFPGRKKDSPINRETPRMALRKLKDCGIDTTSHGLRSLGRTYLEESGKWEYEVMEAALAHDIKNKTVAAYDRSNRFEKRRKMLEWWGKEIQNALHAFETQNSTP